jgi:hypothetical protein
LVKQWRSLIHRIKPGEPKSVKKLKEVQVDRTVQTREAAATQKQRGPKNQTKRKPKPALYEGDGE